MVPYEVLFLQLRGGFNIKLGLRTKFSFSFFLFVFELILWSSKDNTSHLLKRFDFAIETPLSKYNNLTASSTLLNILLLDKCVFVCISTIMTLLILFHLFVCCKLHQQQEDNFRHSLQHPPASKSKVEMKDCDFQPKVKSSF